MADSSMRNIGNVEQYGKNLANVNLQMLQIFAKLKQQTDGVEHGDAAAFGADSRRRALRAAPRGAGDKADR